LSKRNAVEGDASAAKRQVYFGQGSQGTQGKVGCCAGIGTRTPKREAVRLHGMNPSLVRRSTIVSLGLLLAACSRPTASTTATSAPQKPTSLPSPTDTAAVAGPTARTAPAAEPRDPPIAESGEPQLMTFVPKGWRLAMWLPGDFDGDSRTDHVVILAKENPSLVKPWKKSQWDKQMQGEPAPGDASWTTDLENRPPVLDGNPRIFLVLMSHPDGKLHLAYRSDTLLPGADLKKKLEPLKKLAPRPKGFYLEFRADDDSSSTIRGYQFAYAIPARFDIVLARASQLPKRDGLIEQHAFDFVKREHQWSKGQMEFGGGAGYSVPQPTEVLKAEPFVTLEHFQGPHAALL
jgi:hypothetical protein